MDINTVEAKLRSLNYYHVKPKMRIDPTVDQLRHFESTIGYQLTPDYFIFLLNFGGIAFHGVVEGQYDSSELIDDTVAMNVFFGFYEPFRSSPVSYDMFYNFRAYQDRLPAGLIPVADPYYGNLICLNLSTSCYGSVMYWNPTDHSARRCGIGLSLLAPSFSDFLASLSSVVSPDDEDES